MIKKLLKYPIFYLMTIVVIYSVYDYLEHITRSGSIFEENPWYWLLFNIAAVSSFIGIVLIFKQILQNIFNKKSLVFEVIAIGIWLVSYLSVLGPLFDKLFWPKGELNFGFKFGPVFIILIAYFAIRLIINLIVGKNILYSK